MKNRAAEPHGFFLVKIKLIKPLVHCLISEAYHLIFFQNILFRSSVLASDAAVHLCIFVIEHVNIKIPHKA